IKEVESPKERAIELKNKGNTLFKDGKYEEAITFFTQAIELNQTDAAFFHNRSFCYFKLGKFAETVDDATHAIDLKKTYVKAYFRRALGRAELDNLSEAINDLTLARRYTKTQKTKKRIDQTITEFTDRLGKKPTFSLSKHTPKLHWDSEPIPSVYKGPVFPDPDETLPKDKQDASLEVSPELAERILKFLKEDREKLPISYTVRLLATASRLCRMESNVVELPSGKNKDSDHMVTIVGDTHGQFYDFCHVLEENGMPSQSNRYVFLGDYVDRGAYGIEIVLLLCAVKIAWPQYIVTLRGNHESRSMNSMFGFQEEVQQYYGSHKDALFDLFSYFFESLPLAASVGDVGKPRIFCVHGGIPSDESVGVCGINAINRFMQPPSGVITSSNDVLVDLLWSDPSTMPGKTVSPRGAGFQFGNDICKAWLVRHGYDRIYRAHQIANEGTDRPFGTDDLVTVFSCANYCGTSGNKGAYVRVSNDLAENVKSYDPLPPPHPRVSFAQKMQMFYQLFGG
ncbi:Serine/threonine-protein phosphatase 5, partial [Aduncisulcus paluster]